LRGQTMYPLCGQTDRQGETYIPPPNFVCGGYKNSEDMFNYPTSCSSS